MTNLEEFQKKYSEIQSMGWVKTHRSNNTGIGKTLEDLLGIEENNIQEPDFGVYELKSKRISAKSMLTLFTKAPLPHGVNSKLVEYYGYLRKDKVKNKYLYCTIKALSYTQISDTGHGLTIDFFDSRVLIKSDLELNPIEAYWTFDVLKKISFEKIQIKIFVCSS